MKSNLSIPRCLALAALALLTLNSPLSTAQAQGTAFTYQGRLSDGGSPANGLYDLQFTLWDAPASGLVVAGPLVCPATSVTNGLFVVTLDFGAGVFTGPERWLEVDTRTNGAASFTALLPLQPIQPVPYAVMANSASNLLGTLPAAQLSGTAGSFSATNITFTGSITGNGAGLTNLNASQLTAGTLPLAQLPAVVITNNSASLTVGGTASVAPLTVTPTVPAAAIGSVATGTLPQCVAVSGRYAYVANQIGQSLQIFDVSAPNAPVPVGSVATGNAYAVAVAGRYAYVVNYVYPCTLQIIDVSTPSAPVTVGSVSTGLNPTAVSVAGRYAYVVNDIGETLQIFDVGIPSAPVSVGSVPTSGQPLSLAVAGRYAYVVDWVNNCALQVFDVSAPSAPVKVGSIATGGQAYSVAVSGRYAYVANKGNNTLQVFDVSNPANPVSVGSAATMPGGPNCVAVAGRYAYVTFWGSDWLQVFDVSTPSAPVSLGYATMDFQPNFVAVAGRYAYVVGNGNKLLVFDMGGAFIQQLETGALATGSLQTSDTATVGNDLDVRGGLTVSASARISGGLSVDNGSISASNFIGNAAGLTNLNAASLTGPISGNGAGLTNLNASQLTTGTLPLAQLPPGVITVNSTNGTTAPSGPIGSVAIGEFPSIAMAGSYVYEVDGYGDTLQVIDVSDPKHPVSVGSAATGRYPTSVAVAGNYAYVIATSANRLEVFDVSTPSAPVRVGWVYTAWIPDYVTVAGTHAYVRSAEYFNGFWVSRLEIFDVSAPSAPVGVGSIDIGSDSFTVCVAGNYAYMGSCVTEGDGADETHSSTGLLQVFDVSDPTHPVKVGSAVTDLDPFCLTVAGSHAYVGNQTMDNSGNTGSLQIFDVSNPSAPVSVGSTLHSAEPVFTIPWSVAVVGSYAYVGNIGTYVLGTASLQIFDVSNPSDPVCVRSVGTDPEGAPTSLAASGRYAYVANWENDYKSPGLLQIFDVGGGGMQLSGNLNVVNGSITATNFIGNGAGLTNLNASQLTGGAIPLAQLPAGVVTNNAANLTFGGTTTVSALSAPPTGPSGAIGSLAIADDPFIVVVGGYAYVVGGVYSNTLQIIDVSDPTHPVRVGSAETSQAPFGVAVAGGFAYVVDSGAERLEVFDVSTPSAPVLVNWVYTTRFLCPQAIALAGNYAYVVCEMSEIEPNDTVLQVFDVSTPSVPVSVGSLDLGNYIVYNVCVSGSHAYVGKYAAVEKECGGFQYSSTGLLEIIDVSDPTNPVSVASAVTDSDSMYVAVAGRYAYVGNVQIGNVDDNGSLQIFDVSNPSAPVSVGSTLNSAEPVFTKPGSVALAGSYAYVANLRDFTLQIFDVSNPAHPVLVSSVGTAGWPNAIAASGRYAYVANGSDSYPPEPGLLQIFDVSGGSIQVSGGLNVVNGSVTAANFIGNGAGLTNLNAAGLSGSAGNFSATNITVSGGLYLPAPAAGDALIYSGGNTLVLSDVNSNFFAGTAAGNLTQSGADNTGVGMQALANLTTGGCNTAIGAAALFMDMTGSCNTAGGYGALYSNTNNYNTAYGYEALYYNTSGNFNTAIGMSALQSNSTGIYNTATGAAALQHNTTGSRNTANGAWALQNNTTGIYNTATGEIALENNTTGNANTATGQGALFLNTTGNNNTATGEDALFNNSTGFNNTATGQVALYLNTTGSCNTATGQAALSANTTGNDNTATGYLALNSNTSGYNNTANGYQALQYNTTGKDNTAIGEIALEANTTGINSTAVGVQALASNTIGSGNAAFGLGALKNNTTGSYNAAFGGQAGYNLTTGSSNIDIGNQGVAGDNNTIRIGDVQTSTFIAGEIYGDGGGLTNLNMVNLTGSVSDLTLTGNLYLPATTASADAIYSGSSTLIPELLT